LPSLCIGMELVRANNYALAQEFLLKAKEICPFDPLVYNELGVIYFRNKYITDATAHFEKALKLVTNDMRNKDTLQDSWEPTVFNLGHCYRKLKYIVKKVRFELT
jgi:anaphase-promoting complex subunit 6